MHLFNKHHSKEYKQIARSKYFDKRWYLRTYPDVAAAKADPVQHYLEFGWKEGRNPSSKFNTGDYLALNSDVEKAGMNPLLHYIRFGKSEGRVICKPSLSKKKIVSKKNKNTANRGVIYTCITGGYDNLIQHNYQDKNWDYICFTDNKELLKQGTVGQWTIKPLKFNKLDNVRNARWHKTHPHELLKEYEYSIWMDGNINVTGKLLFENAKKCINEHRIISVPQHPKRNCTYDEAITVKALRKDFPEIIDKEVAELKKQKFPTNVGLNETNIIFRYHNDEKCIAIMDTWFDFIERFSRRDQLSFNYALWKNNYVMKNFSGPKDVRYNPDNFVIVKTSGHNGTIPNTSNLTTSIIIPIYNALDDVKITLQTIESSDLSDRVSVILVNDCSGDETTEFLRDFVKGKKRYKLLENKKNLGFVGTCNNGIDAADSDIVILLNSDTMIPKGFESRILACFESDDSIGVASPLGSSTGLWDLPFKQGMTYEEMDQHVASVSDCLYPNLLCPEGFCFCVRKKVIDKIGKLDKIFGRGYCEETDFALRALNAGWRTVLIDNLYVYHKRHASFGLTERNIQMEKNRKILWGRWQKLYDANMPRVQMSRLKRYIKDVIYYDDHKYKECFERDSKYKKHFLSFLNNFDKMPPVVIKEDRKPTFNIFIPNINKNSLTAGPLGILYLGNFLYKSGFNVRFLIIGNESFDVNALRQEPKLSKMVDHVEFLSLIDRTERIEISPDDICVATIWNSAYIAKYIQSKCNNKKFIYMIQDYETIFYPNSSTSALIDATYDFDYNAIFSTEILQKYFEQNKIGRFKGTDVKSISFDTAASAYLPNKNRFMRSKKEKKQFVFYGRPHRARNMYDFGCYVINQAIERGMLDPQEWDFISVGANEKEIHISEGVIMKALPYMDVESYKKKMSEMDLCLSLMLSPHPSMVPIDLALSGAVVVTNTYANKTEKVLNGICKNIFAAKPTVDDILSKLQKAISLTDDLDQRYINAKESTYCDKYEKMFDERHLKWIKNLYKNNKD